MDLDLLLDILNKHNVDNAILTEDLFNAMTEIYRDGYFDGMQDLWYQYQDQDTEWIEQWLDDGEQVKNESYEEYVKMTNKDIPPGSPIDREEDKND